MQPTVSACLTDTLYKSRTHPFGREPITNRAKPNSPKILFSGPIQIYQHRFELSIHLKAVDGSSRQRPALPVFSTWRAGHCRPHCTWQAMHSCMIQYLASRACTYRFCKLASSVRMDDQYLASSVQIRTCANFCTGSLGTHPKPRDRTSASCAF